MEVLTLARLAAVGFAAAFWLLQLAGISGFISICVNSNSLNGCNTAVGLEWWAVWFQFLLLFPVGFYTVRPQTFGQAQSILFTFMAMNCSVAFAAANKFVTLAYTGSNMSISTQLLSFYRVAAAGFIAVLFANFVWLILTGVVLSYYPVVLATTVPRPPPAKSDINLPVPGPEFTHNFSDSPYSSNPFMAPEPPIPSKESPF